MNWHSPLTIILFTLAIGGCDLFEDQERRFLSQAQDRATLEEVQQRLGMPALTKTTLSGEPVSVYRIYDWQPGDNRVTAAGTRCDEYILTFDQAGVLRRWTLKTYFHGGEAFPTYCVPDRYYSAVE